MATYNHWTNGALQATMLIASRVHCDCASHTDMVSGPERRRAHKRRDRKRRKQSASEEGNYSSAAQTTSGTTSSPQSTTSASVQSAQSAHAGPPSRRPAEAKRKLVANDIQGIITTLKSDDVDDILSLSRRRELSDAAEQLDKHTRDYVQYGRRHAHVVAAIGE